MTTEMITVNLPAHVLQRLVKAANVLAMTKEDLLSETISLLLPALEPDLKRDEEHELSKLILLSDIELWKVARCTLDEQKQLRLEELAELRKEQALGNTEQDELESLMLDAQQTMLTKAEAYRLLAMRGHTVFPTSEN